MLIELLLLSISVSIDSFGIGITYGLKNMKITNLARFILFIISITITTIAIYLGNIISCFLPAIFTELLGTFLLILMGSFIIFECFHPNQNKISSLNTNLEPTIHKFFIRSLGMTIQIIKNPISSDIDGSKMIDAKEAIYLGFALSIDSLCIGIGSSVLGYHSILFPIFVSLFQLLFISIGSIIGKKITQSSKIPNKFWNIISGILLIFIGLSKMFLSI